MKNDSSMLTSALSLFLSMLIWGSAAVAETSEPAQDLAVDSGEANVAGKATDPEVVSEADTTPGEEEPGTSETTPNTEERAAEPVQVQAPSRKRNRLTSAIERFTPTEEISADNAVPFPVDI
jgi:hypothetical protein